jgi:hypothetical protein
VVLEEWIKSWLPLYDANSALIHSRIEVPMAMETAAAILTKLALEQNTDLKSRLSGAQGQANVVALIMPVFRQILAELQEGRQAQEKFPSAVPRRFPSRSANVSQPGPGKISDAHSEEHHGQEDDIGGEG